MDYFNELLDSYSKLKKRTFKLQYINEQEKKEEDPGLADRNAAAEGGVLAKQAGEAAFGGEAQTGVGNNQNIDVTPGEADEAGVVNSINFGGDGVVGAFANGVSFYRAGTGGSGAKRSESWPPNWTNQNSKGYKVAIAFYGAAATDSQTRQAQAQDAEADKQAGFDTPGSLMDSPEHMERFAATNVEDWLASQALKESLTDAANELDKLCKENVFATIGGDEEYNICDRGFRAGQYIGGTKNISLEYKLVNGQSIQIDPDGYMFD